jgi:hypothetical protein
MLLPMLGDLLTREYQLQASVRDDVAFLKAELESMEATLLQISEAPADRPPDAQDSLWAQEIRELSYDVEDCVEAFLVRVHHHAPAPAPPGDRDLLQGLRGLINRGLGLLRRAKIRRDMGAAAASGRSERRRGWGMVRSFFFSLFGRRTTDQICVVSLSRRLFALRFGFDAKCVVSLGDPLEHIFGT